jgi:hypothetical protein
VNRCFPWVFFSEPAGVQVTGRRTALQLHCFRSVALVLHSCFITRLDLSSVSSISRTMSIQTLQISQASQDHPSALCNHEMYECTCKRTSHAPCAQADLGCIIVDQSASVNAPSGKATAAVSRCNMKRKLRGPAEDEESTPHSPVKRLRSV